MKISAQEAIVRGLAPDGGLFLPEALPSLARNALENLKDMPYGQRAVYLMSPFLTDFRVTELTKFTDAAYGPDRFDTREVAPVRALKDDVYALELWHGPTCAFKDLALQMLPWLLTASMQKQNEERTVCILVATSGDTGKAALEGFRDVTGTKILVFYPKDGVSAVQELQMVTQAGDNVGVCAVNGNFDDAQNGVKQIFSDEAFREKLNERDVILSSANSINWGRVLPQLVYYVSAYCDMLKSGAIAAGDKINICVPTGNFGNILAAYYAREMGLPVKKFICASNENNVLTDFLRTGVYDRNRDFHTTISPSMDILISSNLERLLFSLSTRDDAAVRNYMEQLRTNGRYTVSAEIRDKLQNLFLGGFCGDKRTKEVIAQTWKEQNYLVDTHTAVGLDVLDQYRRQTGDTTPALVASTASPFKFCDSVLEALGEASLPGSIDNIDRLTELTGIAAPAPLSGLRSRRVRFTRCVEREKMEGGVLRMLSCPRSPKTG
jgi:threonine synthase